MAFNSNLCTDYAKSSRSIRLTNLTCTYLELCKSSDLCNNIYIYIYIYI